MAGNTFVPLYKQEFECRAWNCFHPQVFSSSSSFHFNSACSCTGIYTRTHTHTHSLLFNRPISHRPSLQLTALKAGRYGFQVHPVSITCTNITHLLPDENNDSTCRRMPGIPRLWGSEPDGLTGLVVACVIPEVVWVCVCWSLVVTVLVFGSNRNHNYVP